MHNKHKFFYSLLFFLVTPFFANPNFPNVKPFVFNPRITAENSIANCSKMNTPIVDKNQRIKLSDDGHLQVDGKRIRIYGTNISSIPSKKDAQFWAQTLASQGYNCIRIHHHDSSWANCFLKYDSNGKHSINFQKLDDFDYFVNELKKVGIYVNINLLVGRDSKSVNGMPSELNSLGWKERHALGFWNEDALQMQRDYAEAMLNHKNPYTNITYAQDPATAIVEVNNENGLMASFYNRYLDLYPKSVLQELEDKWNLWLKNHNYSKDSLLNQFNKNYLIEETILHKNSVAYIEQHETAKANFTQGKGKITTKITKNGKENWHIQIDFNTKEILAQQVYTLKFAAKANKDCEISVSLMQDHEDWQNLGFTKNIKLTNQYENFEFIIIPNQNDTKSRLTFGNLGFSEGTTVDIKDISLVKGGNVIIVKDGTKENSVEFPSFDEYQSFPYEYKKLIINFLYDTENEYWTKMRTFIKEDLKSQSLLMGTICSCTTQGLMNNFDIIDAHAYWHHPVFPGADWDNSNYFVQNENMASSKTGGFLSDLAIQRVYGKPFSVSEFDMPYPNQFSSELMPMVSSFASFQDWDCLFNFCFEITEKNSNKAKITGFFDQANNPSKNAANMVASRIFRNFLVKSAKTDIYSSRSMKDEIENMPNIENAWSFSDSKMTGIPLEFALVHKVGIFYADKNSDLQNTVENNKKKNKNLFYVSEMSAELEKIKMTIEDASEDLMSDTNEIIWNAKLEKFIVKSENCFVNVSQNYQTDNFHKSQNALKQKNIVNSENEILENTIMNVKISFKPKDDFCVVAGAKTEKNKFAIFSCSWSCNSNEKLYKYGKGEKPNKEKFNIIRQNVPLTTGNDFSKMKEPSLALGSEGSLFVNSKNGSKLFALNADGTKKSETMPIKSEKTNAKNDTNIQIQTEFLLERNLDSLWYELEFLE